MIVKDSVKAFAALEDAIEVAGGRSQLSKKLAKRGVSVSPQAIGNWRRVPLKYLKHVSELTGVRTQELIPEALYINLS